MSRVFVASLALRLFGIYALVAALQWVGALGEGALEWIASTNQPSDVPRYGSDRFPVTEFVAFAVWLVTGVVCLTKADFWARRWAGDESESSSANGRVDARALELVGYRLIGALVLANYLPQAIGAVAVVVTTGNFGNTWGYEFGSVAAVAVGFYLLFGARGLASLVDRARGAGLQPGEQAWKSPPL
jgi:hypothetical protein